MKITVRNRQMKNAQIFMTALMLGAAITPYGAAEESQDLNQVFTPESFSTYAPLNARDMVERIPGFRLDNRRSNDAARGLGQATENVLINGQRTNSKSSSAADILERIPASTVERIELLDGASLDIPGLSGLVVNVVAKPQGVTGTWSYRPSFRPEIKPFYNGGDISVSGQRGNLGWSLNFESSPRGITGTGTESVYDAASSLIERRDIEQTNLFPEYGASIGARWTPSSGLIANLNLDLENSRRNSSEISKRMPVSGPTERRDVNRNDETDAAEISTDIEFGLGPGRLKLIGVYADRESPFTSTLALSDELGEQLQSQFFRQVTDETETIFRTEYNLSGLGGSWETSLEHAQNKLDSDARLLEAANGTELALTDIGDQRVSVEETRTEAFVTHSRELSDALSVQISIGTEVSELTSSGATGQTRSFVRPKGGLTMNWRATPRTTINARIDRQIGQLDFFDFVSQIDLEDGDDQAGNSNIVPEQSWRGEIEIERSFGAWGAGTLLVFTEHLEDIVDQIPIGTGEGPGNIESGRRHGVELEGTLDFGPIGLSGAQLTYSATFQDSQIDDPLTGESRTINGDDPIDIDLELRHDIDGTALAWGGEFSPRQSADRVRLNSIRTSRDLPGRYRAFIEHKDVWGMTARAEIVQPLGNVEKETRQIFSPDRTGALIETERSRIEENSIFILELSGKF